MSSKSKITIQKTDELEAVDTELADAMSLLDQTNERINEVLRSFSPTEAEPGNASETAEASGESPSADSVSVEPDPAPPVT
jgi:hypothetical protein